MLPRRRRSSVARQNLDGAGPQVASPTSPLGGTWSDCRASSAPLKAEALTGRLGQPQSSGGPPTSLRCDPKYLCEEFISVLIEPLAERDGPPRTTRFLRGRRQARAALRRRQRRRSRHQEASPPLEHPSALWKPTPAAREETTRRAQPRRMTTPQRMRRVQVRLPMEVAVTVLTERRSQGTESPRPRPGPAEPKRLDRRLLPPEPICGG
jgi:hypothetical protein